MRQLKYILLILFSFLLNNSVLAKETGLGEPAENDLIAIKDKGKIKQLNKLLDEVDPKKLERLIGKVEAKKVDLLLDDIAGNKVLRDALVDKPEMIDAWESINKAGFEALARNPIQLQKFDDLVTSNNLGLDATGIENLLKSKTATKDLPWEHPDEILDAIKRGSDGGVDGISIKGFPEPADGNTSFVLSNAKQYQKEASGDALLSFDKGGVSFDNVTPDGKLIDRKYGHSSVFNADGSVSNQTRANSILDQIERQITANGGNASGIRWEISSQGGADGIEQLFLNNPRNFPGLDDVEVIHVPQQTIITN